MILSNRSIAVDKHVHDATKTSCMDVIRTWLIARETSGVVAHHTGSAYLWVSRQKYHVPPRPIRTGLIGTERGKERVYVTDPLQGGGGCYGGSSNPKSLIILPLKSQIPKFLTPQIPKFLTPQIPNP